MAGNDEVFFERLLAAFRAEADEHIANMTLGIIELEKDPEPQAKTETVETVFREAHSLKGASRAVNQREMETICQSFESVLFGVKRQEVALTPPIFDALHRAVDTLAEINRSFPEKPWTDQGAVARISEMLTRIAEGQAGAERAVPDLQKPVCETVPPAEPAAPGPEAPSLGADGPVRLQRQMPSDTSTVRISMDKLDVLLRQSEELLSLKLMADRHLEDILDQMRLFEAWNREWLKIYPLVCELRRKQEKNNKQRKQRRQEDLQTAKILEFGTSAHDYMKALWSRLSDLRGRADHTRYATGLMVDNLLVDVKKIMMLPCSTLFKTFPKLLRDLSHDQGKDVELTIHGGEIGIDRRILEEMRVVFIHLLRNTIDHGIERPGERVKNSKPPRGTIRLAVSRLEGGKVEMLLSDDGGGVDLEALKASSIKRGMLSSETAEKLDGPDILSLAFQSGVSTSPVITDMSGRGLGLAIVREKVEKLGGQVSIETSRRTGTSVRITLPLTLATFRGVLVTAAEHLFVVPTANVERSVRIRREDVRTVENRDTLSLDGVAVSLSRLSRLLELPEKSDERPVINVLILGSQGKRMGVAVDEIQNEQEVLIKNLGWPLVRIRNVAAATVLGSGKVVPVLNVSDLAKSAVTAAGRPAKPVENGAAVKKSVLVVEDSITSRMLLKNIFETSGYLVVTAVDGMDAMTRLKTETFDIVVSDVDMPRMNGFNLTEKIRKDEKLSDLPVVLVTALDSREDRERGIDVGANAYIVKSSFDQSNLLEIVRRLI